jgi:serine/threonine protein kinase
MNLYNDFNVLTNKRLAPNSKGVYQSTFVGCSRATGDKVTIKEHHLKQYPHHHRDQKVNGEDGESIVVREVLFLARLAKCPGGLFPRLQEMFITDTSIYLVTNYIDPFRLNNVVDIKTHSPDSDILGKGGMHPLDVKRITKSLVQALAHAHEHQIILRDLNPQNIMIRRVGNDPQNPGAATSIDVMIVDLSLAVSEGSIQILSDHPLFEWYMVPYLPPESVLGHPYSSAMDIWSLGVLIYAMISGQLPFEEDPNRRDDGILIKNITTARFVFYASLFENVETETKAFIRSCLRLDSNDRITAKQALKHSWVQ